MRSSGLGWVPVVLGLLFVAAGLYHFGAELESRGYRRFGIRRSRPSARKHWRSSCHTAHKVSGGKLPNGPIAALPAGGFSAGRMGIPNRASSANGSVQHS